MVVWVYEQLGLNIYSHAWTQVWVGQAQVLFVDFKFILFGLRVFLQFFFWLPFSAQPRFILKHISRIKPGYAGTGALLFCTLVYNQQTCLRVVMGEKKLSNVQHVRFILLHNCSAHDTLICIDATFDVVSGCCSNHKRTGVLI